MKPASCFEPDSSIKNPNFHLFQVRVNSFDSDSSRGVEFNSLGDSRSVGINQYRMWNSIVSPELKWS